jgi:hypothetical protein
MSLNVSEALIRQAAVGEVDEPAFVETIRQSLPYAWGIVEKLAHSIHQEGEEWANHAVAPPLVNRHERNCSAWWVETQFEAR